MLKWYRSRLWGQLREIRVVLRFKSVCGYKQVYFMSVTIRFIRDLQLRWTWGFADSSSTSSSAIRLEQFSAKKRLGLSLTAFCGVEKHLCWHLNTAPRRRMNGIILHPRLFFTQLSSTANIIINAIVFNYKIKAEIPKKYNKCFVLIITRISIISRIMFLK